jgi:hypothetical protein
MLRSGGVPAWLQLLGAPGNRKCACAKAFGRIRLGADKATTAGRPNAWCVGGLRMRND